MKALASLIAQIYRLAGKRGDMSGIRHIANAPTAAMNKKQSA
jgi:hypothetical protein